MLLNDKAVTMILIRQHIREQLADNHAQIKLLETQIKELRKVADEKVKEELKTNKLYNTVMESYNNLSKTSKALEETYIHWFYFANEACEGWDFDNYNAENEKIVKPLKEMVDNCKEQCYNLREIVIKPIKDKYYVEITPLQTKIEKLRDGRMQLLDAYRKSYQLMKETLNHVLETYTPLIENIFKEMGYECKDKTPTIYPELVDGNWRIEFEYCQSFEYTDYIDDDDFDDEASSIKHGVMNKVDDFAADFEELCKTLPGFVKAEVGIDEDDIAVEGDTYHHEHYYEPDTGYGEPEGDFYYGDVTASVTASISVIIE